MVGSNKKMLILGCGGVAQCALPIIFDVIKEINPSDITIIDFEDTRSRIKPALDRGVIYIQEKITPQNVFEILSRHLKSGDILVDLAWNIDTSVLLDWCHNKNVLFINTSVEQWEPYRTVQDRHPTELTLYARQMEIGKLVSSWNKKGPTAIVDHGANPGLVSHFVKEALVDIASKISALPTVDASRKKTLSDALSSKNFAQLAHVTGVKTIHISERDTQIINRPKKVNEFVNSWSVEGLVEEGMAPAELGWGTHEKELPSGAMEHLSGPKNQICLASMGVNTLVRSWVPSGPIIGMVIRHGEAFSLSERLTVWDGNKVVYRPTVHYAYCLSDSAYASLREFKMRNFVMQENVRIMNDEIIDGEDELGCLLMGHDLGAWWIGSILDIHQARKLVPGQSGTTVQVAAGLVAAMRYMLDNPEQGFRLPDDLDYQDVLKVAKPYLGKFVSKQVDWNPLRGENGYFNFGKTTPSKDDVWQFLTFLVKDDIYRQ